MSIAGRIIKKLNESDWDDDFENRGSSPYTDGWDWRSRVQDLDKESIRKAGGTWVLDDPMALNDTLVKALTVLCSAKNLMKQMMSDRIYPERAKKEYSEILDGFNQIKSEMNEYPSGDKNFDSTKIELNKVMNTLKFAVSNYK